MALAICSRETMEPRKEMTVSGAPCPAPPWGKTCIYKAFMGVEVTPVVPHGGLCPGRVHSVPELSSTGRNSAPCQLALPVVTGNELIYFPTHIGALGWSPYTEEKGCN